MKTVLYPLIVSFIFCISFFLTSCKGTKIHSFQVKEIILFYSLYDHLPFKPVIQREGDVIRSSMYPFIVNTLGKERTIEMESLINSSHRAKLKDNTFGATVLCILVKKNGKQDELLVDLERKVFSYDDAFYENDDLIHLLQQIAIENLLKERTKWIEPFPFKN